MHTLSTNGSKIKSRMNYGNEMTRSCGYLQGIDNMSCSIGSFSCVLNQAEGVLQTVCVRDGVLSSF